ncbi:MAG: rhamnulokinase [Clostridia bacterium]|nr:rhamnulokinase [Clostridia bacterium]
MKYFLAIDIGASSGRHILSWKDGDKIKIEEIYRFENSPINSNGSLTWKVERLFSEILNGLKRAGELGKIPYSVGIDTWGVDYALLDEKDKVIDSVYCYRDNRTQSSIPQVHAILPFEKLFERTGIAFTTFNSIYQLYHDLKSGKMQKASSMLMIPDYFHFRLTGKKVQEYTNATTTGLVNAKTHEWDWDIIQALGLKKGLFGTLSQPGTVVGDFSKEVALFVGYNAKVVLPATHDTASAVIATPLKGQTPYISSGTWSLLGVEQNNAFTSADAMASGYSNEGGLNFTFRLQKNIMGLWMIQQIRHEVGDKYSFAELAEMAVNEPIDALLDVNDQRFLAPNSMINEIKSSVGCDLTIGQIAYCIFNSLACDYDKSLKDLEQMTGEKYQTLNIIGGGSKNELLNKLTKQKTGKRVITGPTEGTALGNLIVQMVSANEIESVSQGREFVANSFEVKEVN